MNSRERVMKSLNFQAVDRLPMDLGGMGSTGISCFAYPKLVAALGLKPRLPRVYDTGQMLALPDADVLDALGCDVATVNGFGCTNAFEEPEKWREYDFGGRLPALVRDPSAFELKPDGTIVQGGRTAMVPGSYVFDSEHGGEPLDMNGDLELFDIAAIDEGLRKGAPDAKALEETVAYCKKARSSTDRAIMFRGDIPGFGFRGGIARFSMLCMTEPEHIKELHGTIAKRAVERIRLLIPKIAPYADVLMLSADDQGTQSGTILPPRVYRELFVPYYRMMNDAVHELAPQMKVFLHSCGGIYDILDDVIDAGFDVLNPIQWPAGKHGYAEWKDKCRGRLSMWGGGAKGQSTMPLGTPDDVRKEVFQVAPCLAKDSGFVFCCIHNVLAEVPAENVVAMYRAARESTSKR